MDNTTSLFKSAPTAFIRGLNELIRGKEIFISRHGASFVVCADRKPGHIVALLVRNLQEVVDFFGGWYSGSMEVVDERWVLKYVDDADPTKVDFLTDIQENENLAIRFDEDGTIHLNKILKDGEEKEVVGIELR